MLTSLVILVAVASQDNIRTWSNPPGKRLSSFDWMDGKWQADRGDVVEFRLSIKKLWEIDRQDIPHIEKLYLAKIRDFRKSKSVYDLAKILIFESYYRHMHYRFQFDIVEEAMRNPGLDTYEYARAAWCVYAAQELKMMAHWKLLPLFLSRDPKDPMVKVAVVDLWGFKYSGEPPISILPKVAEELMKENPQRDEFVSLPAGYAWAKYYYRAGKPIGALKKVVEYGRRAANHPHALPGHNKMAKNWVKKYEVELATRTKK